MIAAGFEKIKHKVLKQLEEHLPADLTYHNAAHTADVLQQVQRIAEWEGITGEQELMLLKIAALFHDIGFLTVYQNHEEEGCFIMRKQMQGLLNEARERSQQL
ncbi:MAG: HD domain-containing protein, partial [Panacibacter sp.]